MLKNEKMTHVTQSIKDIRVMLDYISGNAPSVYEGLKKMFAGDKSDLTPLLSDELLSKIDDYLKEYDFLCTDYYMGTPTTVNRLLEQLSVFACCKSNQNSEEVECTVPYNVSLLGEYEKITRSCPRYALYKTA
jgi:uncharacterized protein YutD